MLKIYNTLTGQKEPFVPLVAKTVRMYVCGVTVYDYCHLGHARSALVFDVIRNYLEHCGFTVEFVKNFTDVDDKIIKRANEQRVTCEVITSKYIDAYYEDMGRLGIGRAWREPKATEHMDDIIQLVKTLLQKGLAYEIDGDVYFQVERYPAYGHLSKRRREDLLAGARVEVDERKRHPMDFALWKSSKPGEPSWDSPWGLGRPGWHIECSAMSIRHLGETFDIHGGGMDLIFPHHENEIAQSCGATGKEFARYWVHNGFVQINQEKMSKSLGNFFTIREVFEKWGYRQEVTAETLRYFLLATHYRNPVDFSDAGLQEAKQTLSGFYDLFLRLEEASAAQEAGDDQLEKAIELTESMLLDCMDDDFNTPMAIAQLQDLRAETNRLLAAGLSGVACRKAYDAFKRFGHVLGLFQLGPNNWQFNVPVAASRTVPWESLQGVSKSTTVNIDSPRRIEAQLTAPEIDSLVTERNEARRRKDFAKADQIRKSLTTQGITIEDRPDGTSRWKR